MVVLLPKMAMVSDCDAAVCKERKKDKKQKRIMESDAKEYTSSAADRRRRYEAREGIDVIGNVDSGSFDQQESSVQVTQV